MTIAISSIARTATDQMYAGLDGMLQKGAAHAKARKVDEAVFLNFILPNLYFHTTTAYLILRHLGVDIGKLDFLAAPPR